jgi:peptidoglycan/xylan/chitin deacetylase (PgdA/CDA1 family)
MQADESNSTSLEGQTTQEIELEDQSTLPMTVEQLSAQSVEIVRQNAEQQTPQEINLELQTTLPLVVLQKEHGRHPHLRGTQQQHSTNRALLWWAPLVVFTFLLVSVVIGGSAIEGWFSQNFRNKESTTPIVQVNQLLRTPTKPYTIDITVKLFMDAMMHKDWAAMWLMLSPDSQKLWQGEKDFIHFERAKFGSLIFTSFSDSSAQVYHTWRDPDTTQVYSDVKVLHVSLEASAPRDLLSTPSNLALSRGLFNNTLFALVHDQNNWRVLVAGPANPDAPILVPATPPTTKLLVPIFMYHHVSNQLVRNYLDYGLTVTTTNFNAQLDWFHQHGYHSITQTELFDALYYGKALPVHPMILTFDDGYEDVFTDALPALLAHHFRGVFYIITGMIGGNYMTWNQVRTLAQDGMQIASHTIHHVNVGQPPAWTSTQNELLLSKETLETQLGQPIQFFCYPTGEPFHHDSIYEQQIVLADLFSDGYVGATLDPFFYDSAIQKAQTPYQLPRIRVSGGESLQQFNSILNSTLIIDAYRLANGLAY